MLSNMTDKTKSVSIGFFTSMTKQSYIKFAVSLVYLVGVYLIYLEITLSKLNLYIWKIKHLLGLMPISIMVEKVDEIKKVLMELS